MVELRAGRPVLQGIMATANRTRRVAERVREELGLLLTRSVRDPGATAVTVTRVSMTADLQLARVYYTLLIGGNRVEAARALRRARPYLRRQLGSRLQLRHVPDLRFMYDDSVEREDRIASLLEEIERSGGTASTGPAGGQAAPTTDDARTDPPAAPAGDGDEGPYGPS